MKTLEMSRMEQIEGGAECHSGSQALVWVAMVLGEIGTLLVGIGRKWQ